MLVGRGLLVLSSFTCLGILAAGCGGSGISITPEATLTPTGAAASSPTATLAPTVTPSPTPQPTSAPQAPAATTTAVIAPTPVLIPTPIPTPTPDPTTTRMPTPTPTPTPLPPPAPIGQRTVIDRPDDSDLPQIHLVYAIPADGVDRSFDTNGAIRTSVEAVSYWFRDQSGGLDLRWDTYNGELDIAFLRLVSPEALITSAGAFVREALERELKAAGAIQPNKQYMVYYDGGSTYSCGGGAWPPLIYGVVSAMYLQGEPPGAAGCGTNVLGASPAATGYLDIAMFHEFIHSLGLVSTCAPNQHLAGHVSDSSNDLMWAGDAPWELPPRLDIGNDDYFRHGDSDCPDLAKVGYIVPLPQNYWLPPGVSP